jgi:RNA polymerase sigma-70 factor (ECF subfamily)
MSLDTNSKPAMAVESIQRESENPELLTSVREGDQAAFAILTERYRRQLHVHCYRMLGSFTDAEDIIQETFLHAWRGREAFEGRSLFRTWLYRIATNLCLNAIEKRPRRLMPSDIAPRSVKTSTPPEPPRSGIRRCPGLSRTPTRCLSPSRRRKLGRTPLRCRARPSN